MILKTKLAKKIAWTFWPVLTLLALSPSVKAADELTHCYRFTMPDTPDTGSSAPGSRIEVWCYQHLANPSGSTYIYKGDEPEVRPELAMLVGSDGVMTHGSMRAGEVSLHRVRASEFNPFSVPAAEPTQMHPVAEFDVARLAPSAEKTLQALMEESDPVGNLAIQPGHSETSAPVDALPWRGYWWPQRGMTIANGSNSPLGRYDRFVRARTGSNPNSVAWEYAHHSSQSEGWYGHCNGWAASAILRSEPKSSHRDQASGVLFDVVSQKGILAERDYCAAVSFFGRRNYGRPGDDPKDIYPADFHRVISYYLGNLKKPIAIDYRSDYPVDTHIASGYSMDIQRTSANNYSVTVRLRMHRYDSFTTSTPGVAPAYTRVYRYTLRTDNQGNPVGGNWLSDNPDFMWVPLSPSSCSSSNPQVTENWVRAILSLIP